MNKSKTKMILLIYKMTKNLKTQNNKNLKNLNNNHQVQMKIFTIVIQKPLILDSIEKILKKESKKNHHQMKHQMKKK